MASEMIRPHVVTFLDQMLKGQKNILRVEEILIKEDSDFAGKSIKQCDLRRKSNLLVVALKEGMTGRYIYNPDPNKILAPGDILIVIGEPQMVKKLS